MRVLGTDAIKDPTKMEAHVRKQMAERIKYIITLINITMFETVHVIVMLYE